MRTCANKEKCSLSMEFELANFTSINVQIPKNRHYEHNSTTHVTSV